jgi:hypothetical protein
MKQSKDKPTMVVVGFKATKALAGKLKQFADAEDLSVSQLVRRLLKEKLTEKGLLP